MNEYYVNVFSDKNSPDRDLLKIGCEGLIRHIPKSYIDKNNLTVKAGNMVISKELFEAWFSEDIQARDEEKRIKEEQWTAKRRIFDSFYPFIPLFWKNREHILKDPRIYSIQTPEYFMGLAYTGESSITLGELLQLWEHEESMIFRCKCGGKSVCFQFSGSPLSGTQGLSATICLECAKIDLKGAIGSGLREKKVARQKYQPMEPRAEKTATISELKEACQHF